MIDYLSNIMINIFALIIMIVILLSSFKKKLSLTLDQKLFNYLIYAVIYLLLIDTITWIIDRKDFFGAEYCIRFFNILLYLCGPLVPIIWLCYIDFKIFGDEFGLKKRIIFYVLPAILNGILALSNIFFDVIFEIKPGNEYHRLPLATITFALAILYASFITILTCLQRKRINQRNFIPLLLYMIIPLFFMVIQLFLYGLSLMYMGVSLSMLIVYIRVQSDLDVTDFLTGLSNRRHLEDYLKSKCNHLKDEEVMYGLMIDIDNFKMINDTYGHVTGDQALENISKIFNKGVRKEDFIARYAGDEFVIILIRKANEDVLKDINNLYAEETLFNNTSNLPYKITFSLGYSDYKKGENYERFLNRIDEKMYQDKSNKKNKIAFEK